MQVYYSNVPQTTLGEQPALSHVKANSVLNSSHRENSLTDVTRQNPHCGPAGSLRLVLAQEAIELVVDCCAANRGPKMPTLTAYVHTDHVLTPKRKLKTYQA